MLGGRSSSNDKSIMVGMVNTLMRGRKENGLKDAQKLESEEFLRTISMTIRRLMSNAPMDAG
jgi:hypothetical protein